MADKDISQAVISRLPRYFRYLGDLKEKGVERISSQELSDIMKVTASQIRQDFNNFGGFGQQGYGYNVNYLYDEISKILGIDKQHSLVIIGAGHLGQAIAGYTNFTRRGFVFKGAFDCNPELFGTKIRDVEVRPIDEVEEFVDVSLYRRPDLEGFRNKAPNVVTLPIDRLQQMSEKELIDYHKKVYNYLFL